MDEFQCDKCGLCCQNLNANSLYDDLNDGTGVCKYYDKETHLCTIYEDRPEKCNVKETYAYYSNIMDYEDYLKYNYEACRKMKKEGI